MLTLKEIYKLQADYSVADGSFRDTEVTFEEYMAQCRVFITSNLPKEYHNPDLDSSTKHDMLLQVASVFVDKHKSKVTGYVSKEGVLNSEALLEDVCDSVSGASILKEALEDPEVDEIQINDKNTIFVSRGGRLVPYVDSKGRIMRFFNNDEIHIVLNKLIDDGTGNIPPFTQGYPLLNAKTAQHQYRINAVHFSANTMGKPPLNFPITTAVIRKFKEVKLTIDDLIRFKAITPKMGRLLMLLGRADLKLFCVGATGSGKTTLLNIIANTIPHNVRILLVQNPTEISFMERDEYGRNTRNVVHHEVRETGEDEDKLSATMENLISNTLRETPEVILIGEMRTPNEFYQSYRAMRTGHKLFSTFHAEDAEDGVGRFATEISSLGGLTNTEAVRQVADTIDIIISQRRFPDGQRKVMEIAEVLGVSPTGELQINKLFEYDISEGKVRKNEFGLDEVLGKFRQVGTLSAKLQLKFFRSGVSRDEISEFLILEDQEESEETQSEAK